jgi:hypothetical protein
MMVQVPLHVGLEAQFTLHSSRHLGFLVLLDTLAAPRLDLPRPASPYFANERICPLAATVTYLQLRHAHLPAAHSWTRSRISTSVIKDSRSWLGSEA